LIDPFGRAITYLRLSVTDRCDFRCVYCMADDVRFLPKAALLTLEELDRLATAFVGQGVRKLRITGGEPLVRRNVMWLFRRLARHLDAGRLDELTLTTNGSRLALFAAELAALGVRRVNVSLDSLDGERFRRLTRHGRIEPVLAGIAAAQAAGLRIRVNCVVLAGINDDEIDRLIAWCGAEGLELCLIEAMPMGDVGPDRAARALPLDRVRQRIARQWTLVATDHRSGGPARYVVVAETGGRLGFISPLTGNFCDGCNRVRVTCTGRLFPCLGQPVAADLRTPLRAGRDDAGVIAAIRAAIAAKPAGHSFPGIAGAGAEGEPAAAQPPLARFMNETGG
jgi:cyclic pyranopterin phosphate synthase